MNRAWRTSDVLTEAARNFAARNVPSLLSVTLTALVLGTVAIAEFGATSRLRSEEATREALGAYVYVVQASGGLSATRCESLNGMDGVVSAGGLSEGPIVRLRSAPGTLLQTGSLTPGALLAIAPTSALPLGDAGWLIGESASSELKAGVGFIVDDGRDRLPVVAIASVSARDDAIGRWLLEVRPPIGQVDECWVEFERASHAAGRDVLAAWFDRATDLEIATAQDPGPLAIDPAAAFRSRPEQFAWLPGGFAIALISAVVIVARRRELALYRALGVPRPGLALLVGGEVSIATAIGLVVAISLATAWSAAADPTLSASQILIAIGTTSSAALLGALAIPVIVALATAASIADAIKQG